MGILDGPGQATATIWPPPTGLTPADLGLPADKFPRFREGQDHIALALAASDKRHSLLCAPTGVGKSLIFVTAARLLNARTLVLVGTRGLQDQIGKDFEAAGAKIIKGRSNYRCPEYGTCDQPAEYGEVCACDCPYTFAVDQASRASIVISNYSYWMALAQHGDPMSLGQFDLLVCDEVHTLEDWITGQLTCEISHVDCRNVIREPIPDIPETPGSVVEFEPWRAWCRVARDRVQAEMGKHSVGSTAWKKLRSLANHLGVITASPATTRWAVESGNDRITIDAVRVADFTESLVYRGIPRVIGASATVTRAMAAHLGMPETDLEYREVGDGYDPRRRPVVYVPTVRVDHRMVEGQTRILMSKIDRYIAARSDRKGIIHARSYYRAREIARRSEHADRMLVHGVEDARFVIEKFRRSTEPLILVSPSVEEGFDFPHDLARWQIVVKVPFIDGRSALIKARKADDPSYVNYLAAQSLIQMCGRSTRSEDDWSEVVIFDDHFSWFRNRAPFPAWVKRAWKQMEELPEPLDPRQFDRATHKS